MDYFSNLPKRDLDKSVEWLFWVVLTLFRNNMGSGIVKLDFLGVDNKAHVSAHGNFIIFSLFRLVVLPFLISLVELNTTNLIRMNTRWFAKLVESRSCPKQAYATCLTVIYRNFAICPDRFLHVSAKLWGTLTVGSQFISKNLTTKCSLFYYT